MKIVKYIHSCLLVEENKQTFLFDPGNFSYNCKALDINKLQNLDYIFITHEHSDHCFPPFVKELITKFPAVKIITNSSVKKKLEAESIPSQTTPLDFALFESAPHESIWDTMAPENIAITLFNTLTHPGDSLQFTKTAKVLALPLTAPWGSTTAMIQKALTMKPKVIIPIHDWLWRDEIRMGMYKRLSEFFGKRGISFKGVETGEIIAV